jgi:hypothetical protein
MYLHHFLLVGLTDTGRLTKQVTTVVIAGREATKPTQQGMLFGIISTKFIQEETGCTSHEPH